MSEIEEPPTKVLKIDSKEGVTNLTELPSMPDVTKLLETGDLQEDGHEEWLSEGILTDDDFNPGSQEGNGTDSQLGTSQDEAHCEEEHLDSSMDSDINPQNVSEEHNPNTFDPNQTSDNAMAMEDNANTTATYNESATYHNEAATYHNDAATYNNETDDNAMAIDESLNKQVLKNEPNSVDKKDQDPSVCVTAVIGQTLVQTKAFECNVNVNVGDIKAVIEEQNIEETMKQFDDTKDNGKQNFEDLLKVRPEKKVQMTNENNIKDDDGNDTDELLRMLEEDTKTKKLTKTVRDLRRERVGELSSDDDDFVYEGASAKGLKAIKMAMSKKQPVKAEPEDMGDGDDETDASGDEMESVKKLCQIKNLLIKPGPKTSAITRAPDNKIIIGNNKATQKPKLSQDDKKQPQPTKSILKTPHKQTNKQNNLQSLKREIEKAKIKFAPEPEQHKINVPVKNVVKSQSDGDDDEMSDDDDFLDDDDFDFDDDMEVSDRKRHGQRIMRPEMMDEEVPSDGDSHSDEASLYDEMPSSDSEDVDDWFTLDIRGEKASDYIPLLGSRAKELLLEEKKRVSTRLETLKQSLTALTESGKQQAEKLKEATMVLANLDDMIKTS